MFERWAIVFADQLKKVNPEETEPHDVLVFGFTILFNLLFTFLFILIIAIFLGIPFLALQVTLSFMLLRIFTGGPHLEKSLACSITSIVIILAFVFLPHSPVFIFSYFAISMLIIIRYAPYYEPHQLRHSDQWEKKKKRLALIWTGVTVLIYLFFNQNGFLLGTFLQTLMLTPIGIRLTHLLNKVTLKGGEYYEKNS